jgi:hypothetical protein
MKTLLAIAALTIPAAAFAQGAAVSLEAKSFVARKVTLPDGTVDNKLFDTDKTTVLPGDPVVFMLTYKNQGSKAVTPFEINNPIPATVQYTGVEQPWAVVSVDGGKSFGAIATLKVKAADGKLRPATAADVTNVRWKFAKPVPGGATGRVSYYGIVK